MKNIFFLKLEFFSYIICWAGLKGCSGRASVAFLVNKVEGPNSIPRHWNTHTHDSSVKRGEEVRNCRARDEIHGGNGTVQKPPQQRIPRSQKEGFSLSSISFSDFSIPNLAPFIHFLALRVEALLNPRGVDFFTFVWCYCFYFWLKGSFGSLELRWHEARIRFCGSDGSDLAHRTSRTCMIVPRYIRYLFYSMHNGKLLRSHYICLVSVHWGHVWLIRLLIGWFIFICIYLRLKKKIKCQICLGEKARICGIFCFNPVRKVNYLICSYANGTQSEKIHFFSKYGQILQTHITSYSYRGQKGEGGLLLEAFVFAWLVFHQICMYSPIGAFIHEMGYSRRVLCLICPIKQALVCFM